MHFDPYESPVNKRKRIVSNIFITLIILSVVLAIISVIMRASNGQAVDPYYYNSITVNADRLGQNDNNQFDRLHQYMKGKVSVEIDNQFETDYPLATQLIKMDSSLYNKNKVFCDVYGNDIVVAQCFVSNETDWRDLEIMIYSIGIHENTIAVDSLTAYKISYNTRNGYMNYSDYDSDKFRLTTFSLGISARFKNLQSMNYTLNYNKAIDEKEIKDNFLYNVIYDPNVPSYHNAKYEIITDKTIVYANIDEQYFSEQMLLEMKLDRKYADCFKNLIIEFKAEKIEDIVITLNK